MSEVIHLYHTNDVHSHFEKWPRIQNFLEERKQWHKEAGEETVLFDIGDHMDRWHPYTEGTHGKGNVELLNDAGYQYVTIGNNEGITLPHDSLDRLYERAQFKVLAANIYTTGGTRPDWAIPYVIHTTSKGTRIGLIGVTAFFENFYSKLGWQIQEPFMELAKQINKIKTETDIVIVLSHLGLNDDERLAEDFPEIDVVLGAHTHHILHQGKLVNESLLCCAGKFGMYIGHVELLIDDNKCMISKQAQLYDTNDLLEIEGEKAWIDTIYKKGKATLSEICVDLPRKLESDWFQPSELPELMCEALREWSGADCAFINAGLLLDSLPMGKITKGDIHNILPHPINPCVVEVSGSELREILLHSRNEEWPHKQMTGFGFRGQILGVMVYDNIVFVKNAKQPVYDILIDGCLLEADRKYKLTLPDMFTFGYFFPQIHRKNKEYLLPEFLRDILAWKLKKIFSSS
jgi:5'-nucleotidase